jgi:hypothetical protein
MLTYTTLKYLHAYINLKSELVGKSLCMSQLFILQEFFFRISTF